MVLNEAEDTQVFAQISSRIQHLAVALEECKIISRNQELAIALAFQIVLSSLFISLIQVVPVRIAGDV